MKFVEDEFYRNIKLLEEFDIFFWEYISKMEQWTLLKMHFIPSR